MVAIGPAHDIGGTSPPCEASPYVRRELAAPRTSGGLGRRGTLGGGRGVGPTRSRDGASDYADFLSSAMRARFSAEFGAGLVLCTEGRERAGASATGRFDRRMTWLTLFGLRDRIAVVSHNALAQCAGMEVKRTSDRRAHWGSGGHAPHSGVGRAARYRRRIPATSGWWGRPPPPPQRPRHANRPDTVEGLHLLSGWLGRRRGRQNIMPCPGYPIPFTNPSTMRRRHPILAALLILAATATPASSGTAMPQDPPRRAVELTFLKSLPGEREHLKQFIVLNWFAMDRIARAQGLLEGFTVVDTGTDDGPWNVLVAVTYRDARGYEGIIEPFEKIRRAHRTVPVAGKGLRELGSIVESRTTFENPAHRAP